MRESLQEKMVFIVDDTSFMRTGLIKQLIELGFRKENITQFENGKQALAGLSQVPVDIVFSDWNMPEMNGIDFLKNLRGDPSDFSDVPVVMITTESERGKVIEALKYKLSGYIIKPVQQSKLQEVLEQIFGDENG